MPMMSQILKSVDFTKTQKSRYFENETLFFSTNKKIPLLHTKYYFMAQNSLVAEATFIYFHKTLYLKSLRGFSIYVWF